MRPVKHELIEDAGSFKVKKIGTRDMRLRLKYSFTILGMTLISVNTYFNILYEWLGSWCNVARLCLLSLLLV